jgi:hypothetical protein
MGDHPAAVVPVPMQKGALLLLGECSSRPQPAAKGNAMHKWQCTKCGKLLGKVRGRRLHIQFSRGHQYVTALPAAATCRGCATLNETDADEEFGRDELRAAP